MKRKGKNGRSPKTAQPQTPSGVSKSDATGRLASAAVGIKQEAFNSFGTQVEMASLDTTSLKQVNHFVRGHTFIQISLSGHTTSQRRAFERDVYDYARGLGLQRREAKGEVLKARGFCGEFDYDSDVSMLGDEVADSAQLLAGLSGRPIASQSTPHNASTNQAETMPTPKLTHSKGKKKSRPSDANHGTLLDAEAGEALPEPPHPPKVAKKSKKRKATEIEEEATNPIEFPTPKEKSSRKTSKKSKDKSSTSEVVSQDIQPDDMKRASHRRTAKRQKLEQALDFLDTAKSSAYDDIEQQPDADLSALGNKQKKEKKKDKEGKKSKKAANPAASSAIEVPASHKHGGGSSKERETTKIEDQQYKDDEREVSRLDKIERRRKRREEEIMPNEDRHRDAEVREEDSEDRYTTYKRTEVAHAQFPHGLTTSKHAESNDMVETLAEGTNVSSTSGVDALRAATPELDSVDQPNLGLEVRSVYFTPEKKKPRKARSSPKVKLEMLEQERRKEAKEKQARFRAEIVAATRRLSIGQTGTIPLQIDTLYASRNIIADTPGELSQPTPQIAKAVESNGVETTAPTQTRPRKYQQSENMIDVISKEADISECTPKPFQELIDTLDSTQSARNEDLRQSKSRSSQQTGPAAIYGILSHERAVQNNAQEDGNFDEGIAGAAIEPVIPESLPKHNGWIPINHPSLAATGQPGYREGRTVFGSIRKPESGDGFVSLDGASEDLGENFTLGTDIPVSSTGNRVLRKRKSRANADGGGDESVMVKSTRKPRNVKQEPLDFQSPMIHCTGEELSLKLESALSKLDLASIMLGGTENNSEVLKVSNTTCQSSPLSRPESWASRPAWLLLEGQSVQGFEKRPMFGAPPLLMRPNEQGQLDIGPTFPSFVPQTLSCYSETRPEELKRLFDLLIPSTTQPQIRLRPQHTARESRFFPKPPTEKVSCIPFPPLDADSFGLVQERLCRDPFRLLIAVTFLNKTRGKVALPVCYELFERYPTPEDLANADTEELGALIGGLGLQNQRGKRMIKLAQMWVEKPPQKGQRYRRLHYPKKNDGRDVKPDEPISDDDPRVAWEIAHLPGAGAYAIDSWRIFCRDELRGLPTGFPRTLSPAMIDEELQKEWSRVLPLDKELRAYLRWRWLRLGWNWNSLTGERHGVESDFLDKIRGGGVSLEGDGDCAVEAVYGVVDAGFGSDRQCRGSLSKIPNDDIVAMPEACRAVGGPREARSTDETLGRDPIAKDNSADADTIVVMGQGSVAPSQVDNLPKAVSSLTPRILNGEQLETREDTGSETSPAIEAALSWLHCDDIEDTPDAAMASVATQQAVVVEQLAVKSNPNGADPPCLSAHSESMIQPLSTQIEHVKASPENHNLPKGEMTGAQILRHRLRAVMRELPVAA